MFLFLRGRSCAFIVGAVYAPWALYIRGRYWIYTWALSISKWALSLRGISEYSLPFREPQVLVYLYKRAELRNKY